MTKKSIKLQIVWLYISCLCNIIDQPPSHLFTSLQILPKTSFSLKQEKTMSRECSIPSLKKNLLDDEENLLVESNPKIHQRKPAWKAMPYILGLILNMLYDIFNFTPINLSVFFFRSREFRVRTHTPLYRSNTCSYYYYLSNKHIQ